MATMISISALSAPNRTLFGELHCLMSEPRWSIHGQQPLPLGYYRVGGYAQPPTEIPVAVVSYLVNTAFAVDDAHVKFWVDGGLAIYDFAGSQIARWDALGRSVNAERYAAAIDLPIPNTDSVTAWIEALLLSWNETEWLDRFLAKAVDRIRAFHEESKVLNQL